MQVGTVLREARQRAGLSRDLLAQRTGVSPALLEALEENDATRLPSGAEYQRLVRVYADAVKGEFDANDPASLPAVREGPETYIVSADEIDEFPEEDQLYAGGSTRPVDPDDIAPLAGPVLATRSEPDLDLIDRARADEVAAARPVPMSRQFLGPSRQLRRKRHPATIALPLVALIAAAGIGAYVYSETRPFSPIGENRAVTADPTDARTPSPSAGTTSSAAPSGSTLPSQPVATPKSAVPPAAAPRGSAAAARTREGTPPKVAQPAAVDHADPAEGRTEIAAPTTNVTGRWTFATRVESTAYANYSGLQLGYQLDLEQSGNRITGTGWKVAENGGAIASGSRTPISVAGTIEGNRLMLAFTERGARRASEGKFVLYIGEDGAMRGRFSSDAAASAGTVEAHR